ncbi:MAG TPA: hypothetical protein VJ302_18000 [Blastocatellia bacterium]|nr:hypothetical protein [Blastocatellia bacterium]
MPAIATSGVKDLYCTFDEIEKLIRDFEAGLLPRAQWTHSAHLTVACWFLICYPEPDATRQVREGIQNYNRAVGIVTTRERGYHETLTLFWVRVVKNYLANVSLECSMVGLINELVARYADKNLPFEYYSRDRLMSFEARTGWLEPDLKLLAGQE